MSEIKIGKKKLQGRRALSMPEILACVAFLFLSLSIVGPCCKSSITRSGVAKAKADLHRISEALSVYYLDYKAYPPSVDSPQKTNIPNSIYGVDKAPPLTSHRMALRILTTPSAYLDSVDFNAPFRAKAWEISEAEKRIEPRSYWYNNYSDFHKTARGVLAPTPRTGYLILAFGPESQGIDGISAAYGDLFLGIPSVPYFQRPNVRYLYDPSNGSSSKGNIMRFSEYLPLENGMRHIP